MTDFDESIFNIRSTLDSKTIKDKKNYRICDKYGCCKEGVYKAPKGPGNLREYYYFCLEHVREYNKSWDYFEGCSEEFLQDYMLKDITGHRPTWPMGNIPGTGKEPPKKAADYFRTAFSDPFDLGETIFGDAQAEKSYESQAKTKINKKEEQTLLDACDLLEIIFPPTLDAAKKAYKQHIKKFHPDVNPNDPEAEKKIMLIVNAYRQIEKYCAVVLCK